MAFEALRAEPNGLLVHRLNHSVTLSGRVGSPASGIEKPEGTRSLEARGTVSAAAGRLDWRVRTGIRACFGEGQSAPCEIEPTTIRLRSARSTN